ncbi:hypothetical protein niasHT_005375 [Heterodera trifolii]|uniref:Uncharacterized protein n=1 Tax=Heterodera trifolii TaxID=157864 RepID=A0ABD2M0S9_9BILA
MLSKEQKQTPQTDTSSAKLLLIHLFTISTIILYILPPTECRPSFAEENGDEDGQNAILINDETTKTSAALPTDFEKLLQLDGDCTTEHRQSPLHVHHHRHHHRRHRSHYDHFVPVHSAQRRRHHRRSLKNADGVIDGATAHATGAVRKLTSGGTSGRKHRRSGGGSRLMLTKPYWPWP